MNAPLVQIAADTPVECQEDGKQCVTCLQFKALAEFTRSSAAPDGHIGQCKSCKRDYLRAYRAAHPDKTKKAQQRWSSSENGRAQRERWKQSPQRRESRRRSNAKFRSQNIVKNRAWDLLFKAVQSGRIEKQLCFICGDKSEAHHTNYDEPLMVTWMCRAHHLETHQLAKELS